MLTRHVHDGDGPVCIHHNIDAVTAINKQKAGLQDHDVEAATAILMSTVQPNLAVAAPVTPVAQFVFTGDWG